METRQYLQPVADGGRRSARFRARQNTVLFRRPKFDLAAPSKRGQLVVARYGVGDQFPAIPLQLRTPISGWRAVRFGQPR
jgi:hypothetical protein